MGSLFAVVVGFALIAVLGHGIWVTVAALFSGIRGDAPNPKASAGTCPSCLGPWPSENKVCHQCGWPEEPAANAKLRRALREFARRIHWLHEHHEIDPAVHERLTTAVHREWLHLHAAESPSQAAARPSLQPESNEIQQPHGSSPATTSDDPDTVPTPVRDDRGPSPSVVGVAEEASGRAEVYAARRAEAAETASAAPKVDPRPARRERLATLFSAFMEEKNIRWGELAGGLLIVCSSVALVISFWSQIAQRPFLKFFTFNGVTAALFAAGFYTYRRWRLHTTSRGLLITAAMLVPLNFLSLAAFTAAPSAGDILLVAGELVSIALFAVLLYLASRVVMPSSPLAMTCGVIVPAVWQLLIRRHIDAGPSVGAVYAFAAVPAGAYFAAIGRGLVVTFRQRTVDEPTANRLFILLGVATFALLVPLSLLAYKSGDVRSTLQSVSPLLATIGLPAVLAGGGLWKRLTAPEYGPLGTAALAVAVAGAAAMTLSTALAWPHVGLLIAVATLNGVAIASLAAAFRIPAGYALAGLHLVWAWSLSAAAAFGPLPLDVVSPRALLSAIGSTTIGLSGQPFAILLGIAAFSLARGGFPRDARWVGGIAATILVLSLVLIGWHGLGPDAEPIGAAWIFGGYGLLLLWTGLRWDQGRVVIAGLGMLLVACIQASVFADPAYGSAVERWGVALLAHATITLVTTGAARLLLQKLEQDGERTARVAATASTSVAVAFVVAAMFGSSAATITMFCLWLSAICTIGLLHEPSIQQLNAVQACLFATAFWFVTAVVQHQSWYLQAEWPWLDAWFLQLQGMVLGGLGWAWALSRTVTRAAIGRLDIREEKGTRWRPFLATAPMCERAVVVSISGLAFGLAFYASLPGVAQELDTRVSAARVVRAIEEFSLAAIDPFQAAGWGGWGLLGVAVVLAVTAARESTGRFRFVAVTLLVMCVCPLLAAHAGPSVAVASTLRWLVVGFFLLASAVWWLLPGTGGATSRGTASTKRASTPGIDPAHGAPSPFFFHAALGMVVAVHAAMVGYVAIGAVAQAGIDATVRPWLSYLLVLAGVACCGATVIHVFLGRRGQALQAAAWTTHGPPLTVLLGAGPLVVALLFAVATAIKQHPIMGPEPTSWFASLGWAGSYVIPIAALAAGLVGHAIGMRSERVAFSAALLFHLAATAGLMLLLPKLGRGLDAEAWIQVTQLNAVVAAAFASAWCVCCHWNRGGATSAGDRAELPRLLHTLVSFSIALVVLFVGGALLALSIDPGQTANATAIATAAAGSIPGWTALLAGIAARMISRRGRPHAADTVTASLAVLAGGGMLAMTIADGTVGDWTPYHIWLSAAVLAAAVPLLRRIAAPREIQHRGGAWSMLLSVISATLAFRALDGDPHTPWWTAAAVTALAGVASAWGILDRRQRHGWWAAALLLAAANSWWVYASPAWTYRGVHFVLVNVVAVAASSLVPAWIARLQAVHGSRGPGWRRMGVHRPATMVCLLVLVLLMAGLLAADVAAASLSVSWGLTWTAIGISLLAVACCAFDPHVRLLVARFYLGSVVVAGQFLNHLDLQGDRFWWSLVCTLAALTLGTSYLWSRRGEFAGLVAHWTPVAWKGSVRARPVVAQHSLVVANTLLTVCILGLVFWQLPQLMIFSYRVTMSQCVLAAAMSLGLLARGSLESPLRTAALLVGVAFAVAFGWAWLPPAYPAEWLHRGVIASVAIAAMSGLYGFGLVTLIRRENAWTRSARLLMPLLSAAAMGSLFAIVGYEVFAFYRSVDLPLQWPAIASVAIALLGISAIAIVAAVLPGRDPLGLSTRAKTVYVYAAESTLAVLFAHIRVTMPWLFRGWFLSYWTLVVVAVAFFGVGLSEFFRRRRTPVLAGPLESTGAVLPVLPLMGFWLVPGQVDFAWVLMSIAALYATLAAVRSSLLYGGLAVVAGNVSLWSLYQGWEGFALWDHPQLWLIPPAMSMLVASYLNRDRLTESQMTTIRYASALVVYVSSTAEIFIHGVADTLALPLVLAAVSIAGIFAGILLRVRAFLYLGTSFLFVSLLSVIWHAAVERDHAWIWWVCGILTGASIIAIFAVFEKRRDDVLRVLERMQAWHA